MKPNILVVDDEPDALEILAFKLKEAGYVPLFAKDGARALTAAREERPALIVLDLMLPEVDGLEVCKILRRDPMTATIPILMLTAKASEMDRVLGLELGADDYVTKPFDPRELVARVRAVLRRSDGQADQVDPDMPPVLEVDDLRIEVGPREVYVGDTEVALTPKEFDLLATLVQARGLVLSREQLLERVWGYTFLGDSRTIDVHVRQLRRKLGDACPIETVWGTGYKVAARR